MSDHFPLIGLLVVLIIFGVLCFINPGIAVAFVMLVVAIALYLIVTKGNFPNLRK